MRRLSLNLLSLVPLLLMVLSAARPAAGSPAARPAAEPSRGTEATPERIVSWRIRVLPQEQYLVLQGQWRDYVKAHPNDPLGWTQLARSARYDGSGCPEVAKNARKAIEVDPNYAEAHALLGGTWKLWCGKEGLEVKDAIRELERALELDPENAEPNFSLWVARLSTGDTAGADACLRALLDGNQFPEPVLDFGYNLLIGLEPDAIVLTNGDNDTYPVLALQAARNLRPDVAVVNLSLLNTTWYRRYLREGAHSVPVPLLDENAPMPQSAAAVSGLIEAIAKDGWKRPLYVSVTVPDPGIKNGLSLEGLAYRVQAESFEESKVDVKRFEANFFGKYRLDSLTALSVDWDWANSVGKLVTNYVSLYSRLADALVKSDRKEDAARAMARALALCGFHGKTEMGRALADEWLKWDPSSKEAQGWKAKFGA